MHYYYHAYRSTSRREITITPAMTAPVVQSDELVHRRLMRVLWAYETLVIAVVALAGLNIALSAGGSLPMAAPLALIACAEALRIPLSGWATRLRIGGRLVAFLALAAIAVGSAEGLAVAFEAFLQNRVVEIARAARDVEKAQAAVDLAKSAIARQDAARAELAGEMRELDSQAAELAKSMPQPPAGSNRVCTWKGQRVTCSADSAVAAAYRDAMKAYDARLQGLTGRRAALQAGVDAARANEASSASPAASDALLEAKRAFEEKAAQSPVWRLTASVFGEDSAAVTPAQFATVKKFVAASLAIAFATLSMAVSIAAHLQPRSEMPGKVSRMLRAWLARRRRPIYRDVPGPYRDRVRFLYVPCDPQTGKVLDPDVKP